LINALVVCCGAFLGECTGFVVVGGKKTLQFVANCRCLLFSPDDTTTHSPHQAMRNAQPAAGNSIGAGSLQAKA
jgi:hypothetical protein